MTISEKIQHYRKSKKMSQEDLARSLLVSRQTISLWENGQTLPTIDNLIRLRDIFGVSLDEMLCDDSEPPIRQSEERFDEVYEVIKDEKRFDKLRFSILLRASAVVALLSTLLFSAVFYGFKKSSLTLSVNLTLIAITSFALTSIILTIFITRAAIADLKNVAIAVSTLKINSEHIVLETVKDGDYTDTLKSKHKDLKAQKISRDYTKVCCGKGAIYLKNDEISESSLLFSLKRRPPVSRHIAIIASAVCLIFITLLSIDLAYSKPLAKVERHSGISIPEYMGISESNDAYLVNGIYVDYSAEIFLTQSAADELEKGIVTNSAWCTVANSDIAALPIPDICRYHGAEYFVYREYKDGSFVIVLYFIDENMMSVMLYHTP